MMDFRPMRRERQQLALADCIGLLKRCTSGVLALLGDGGYPYAVPMSYAYTAGRIIMHSALHGHKMDAIAQRPLCSFCVVDMDEVHPAEYTTHFRSVIVFGRIGIVEDAAQRLQALRELGQRFNPSDEMGLQREIERGWPTWPCCSSA